MVGFTGLWCGVATASRRMLAAGVHGGHLGDSDDNGIFGGEVAGTCKVRRCWGDARVVRTCAALPSQTSAPETIRAVYKNSLIIRVLYELLEKYFLRQLALHGGELGHCSSASIAHGSTSDRPRNPYGRGFIHPNQNPMNVSVPVPVQYFGPARSFFLSYKA